MTEAAWLAATDPTPMLEFLRTAKLPSGRIRSRKFRLFLVACCLRYTHLITDSRTRNAISVAELHTQGLATRLQLRQACQQAEAVPRELRAKGVEYVNKSYFHAIASYVCAVHIVGPERVVNEFLGFHYAASDDRIREQSIVASLLRDSFNPFHFIAFDPSWRTEAVVGLARGMYESRDFAPMPVLADALEDAGCADAAILAHCRGDGPHVRGCWVVDLVLGKN
jgi:hypothetical protein